MIRYIVPAAVAAIVAALMMAIVVPLRVNYARDCTQRGGVLDKLAGHFVCRGARR